MVVGGNLLYSIGSLSPGCAMGKINWGRVVLGGLLAGVVLNVFDYVVYGVVLRPDFAATMQALGKPPGAMDSLVPLFVPVGLLHGIGLEGLYQPIPHTQAISPNKGTKQSTPPRPLPSSESHRPA